MKKLISCFFLLALFAISNADAQSVRHSQNVVMILIDGYRWQELFQGADYNLLSGKKFTSQDSSRRMKKYWLNDLDERRTKLMPFTWNYIAEHGQIYGNRNKGNKVNVKNPYWISYPGRAEVLSGFVDPDIDSNSYGMNSNTNVLAFLNQQKGYNHKVATFACWDATRRCINPEKNGTYVNAPWDDIEGHDLTDAEKLSNEMQHVTTKIFGPVERLDANVYALAKSYIKANHPKITYIDFGDTDEYGHLGRYDLYLDDIHNLDKMIKDLWQMMQDDKFYKNNTTFLVFPDHGRGLGKQWTSHGASIPHSDETWLVVMGPKTEPLGEIKTNQQIYQTQFAATAARLLEFDYKVDGRNIDPFVPQAVEN